MNESTTKGAVIYRSSYGSTRQYAQWIAEETGFTLYDQNADDIPWEGLDTVVIGCPVIAMKPFLAGWIAENWDTIKGRRVLLFTASGTDPATPDLRAGFAAAVSQEISGEIDYYPLPGRMIWKKLKPMHKLMMRIGQMITKDPVRKKEMVKDVDAVDRAALRPLIEGIAAAR